MRLRTLLHSARVPLQASPQEAEESIQFALAEGYRHIDTARLYKNEAAVGAFLFAPGCRKHSKRQFRHQMNTQSTPSV